MKLVKLLGVVIFVLVLGNVTLANNAVDESVSVKAVSAEIAALTDQNLVLKQQIAALASLTHIAAKAESLGYVESPQVVSLTSSSVALR